MSDVRENNIVSDEEPAGQERPKMGQHGLIVYLKRCNESEPTGYGSQEDGEEMDAGNPTHTSEFGKSTCTEMGNKEMSGNEYAHGSFDNGKEKSCDVSMETSFLGGDDEADESIKSSSDNETYITSSETEMSPQEWNELTNKHLCYESRAMQESLTITRCNNIPFTDICKIKSYHQVPYRFRCRAHVLHYEPMEVVNMLKIGCHKCEIFRNIENQSNILKDGVSLGILQCQNCAEGLDFDFAISFLLEDNTGIINVLLCGEQAFKFFSAYEMQKIIWDIKTKNEIEEKLKKLTLGQRNSLRALGTDISARPYIECVIQSYFATHPRSTDDDRPFVCYQICDTFLID